MSVCGGRRGWGCWGTTAQWQARRARNSKCLSLHDGIELPERKFQAEQQGGRPAWHAREAWGCGRRVTGACQLVLCSQQESGGHAGALGRNGAGDPVARGTRLRHGGALDPGGSCRC